MTKDKKHNKFVIYSGAKISHITNKNAKQFNIGQILLINWY